MMRLDKFLCETGFGTRSQVKKAEKRTGDGEWCGGEEAGAEDRRAQRSDNLSGENSFL